MNGEMSGLKVWVRGIVQGVGFRPFVYQPGRIVGSDRLGDATPPAGWKLKSMGEPEALDVLSRRIRLKPPATGAH